MFGSTINPADRWATQTRHSSILTPAKSGNAPGQGPTPVAIGSLLGLDFDTTTDASYETFKIPTYWAGTSSFHIHWTKSADPSEAGRVVQWQIAYVVYNGNGDAVQTATNTITLDDTYEDASADGTRVVYRSSNVDVSADFVAGYYVGLQITYVAANTTLLSTPVLISCDLLTLEYINAVPL